MAEIDEHSKLKLDEEDESDGGIDLTSSLDDIDSKDPPILTKANRKTFQSIKKFVNALHSTFGTKVLGLSAYSLFLSRIKSENVFAITKNIAIFTEFIDDNIKLIPTRSINFKNKKIQYSENIFIDFKNIDKLSDEQIKKTIYQHIDVIRSHIYPESKSNLGDIVSDDLNLPDNNEGNMLRNVVGTVAKELEKNSPASPMEAIMQVFSSGLVGNIAAQFQKGSENGEDINVDNLLGALGSLMKSSGMQDTKSNGSD